MKNHTTEIKEEEKKQANIGDIKKNKYNSRTKIKLKILKFRFF